MRHLLSVGLMLPLVWLAACSGPADIAYCEKLGVTPNHSEYQNCIGYFNRQQNWFGGDRAFCSAEADKTYPPTLYDRGSYGVMRGGFGSGFGGGYYGHGYGMGMGHGGFYGSRMVDIQPDYAHNAQVDALRMRIIEPCMQARGWRSGETWEAGRFDGKQAAPVFTPAPPVVTPVPQSGPLPWLNK